MRLAGFPGQLVYRHSVTGVIDEQLVARHMPPKGLSHFVEQVATGEEIIISKVSTPRAKLVPLKMTNVCKKRRLGLLAD